MKTSVYYLLVLFTLSGLFSFAPCSSIAPCFTSFARVAGVKRVSQEPLSGAEKQLETAEGMVTIAHQGGSRVQYAFKRTTPFATLRIEHSAPDMHETNAAHVLNHLRFLNAAAGNGELVELNYNGHAFYGARSGNDQAEGAYETFVMFPEQDVVVYFEFKGPPKDTSVFKSQAGYLAERNRFLGAYASHVNSCKL